MARRLDLLDLLGPRCSSRISLRRRPRWLFIRFKRAWRDGTTGIVLSPAALLERLAALVPPPRAHTVTYHGVLAGHSALRADIVPPPPQAALSRHIALTQTAPPGSWSTQAPLGRPPARAVGETERSGVESSP